MSRVWRHLCLLPVALVLMLASALVLAADARSETPYAVLYGVLEPSRRIAAYPRLRALQSIQSQNRNVTPASIRLEIMSRTGVMVVPVRTDGGLEFPLEEALLRENPIVVSNQPKGTLSLAVTLALAPPATARIPVAELAAALSDVDRLLRELPGQPNRAVRGVEFRFDPRAEARVTLRGASERLLQADAGGRVVLMRDTDLGAESIEVEISQPPLLVLPHLLEKTGPE